MGNELEKLRRDLTESLSLAARARVGSALPSERKSAADALRRLLERAAELRQRHRSARPEEYRELLAITLACEDAWTSLARREHPRA